ncbi:MAG: radical SAM protein [Bacteroidota bacterium]
MIWSKYNYLFKSKKHGYLLFNALSNVFLQLADESYLEILKIRDSPEKFKSYQNADELEEYKIIVENDFDDINILKMKRISYRHRKDFLSLIIIPTLNCNFKCIYCFENAERKTITEETEKDIVAFIMSFKSLKQLSITWYGGESLMAFDRIVSITRKIEDCAIQFESTLITNGYLLNKRKILQLENLSIKAIQITLDGLEEAHDLRRPLQSRKGTFNVIVKNLSLIFSNSKNIRVLIRVNIDKSNVEEYHKVYEFLSKTFLTDKLIIYPGFIDKFNDSSCNSISCLADNREKGAFLIDQYHKYKIYDNNLFPSLKYNTCAARNLNSFVIGPSGEIYKCLCVVGDEKMEIGHLASEDTNGQKVLARFLIDADYNEDIECNNCFYFPICDGGCSFQRINKKYFNDKINTCTFIKDNLEEFLEIHFESKNGL